ncbi:MAG: VCBS repeat-containing protein [Polyangiaceae bacterium]|nr:VCBS repeat-containing protein [Polyangiaceae bacterium]
MRTNRLGGILGLLALAGGVSLPACSGDDDDDAQSADGTGGKTGSGSNRDGGPVAPLPKASCKAGEDGGSETVDEPELVATLFDRWHEAWLASPAVADLDEDGTMELVVPRDDVLLIWHLDGTVVDKFEMPGRIWAPPVVADLRPDLPGLEVAVASRGQIAAWDAHGQPLDGFPFEWRDEMRSIAAEDIDDDGQLELVAGTTSDLDKNGQTDILIAIHNNGTVVEGFPPNTTGASGCDDACYVHAGFDQNVALGDVDDDGVADILLPQDNAYVSLHDGTGRAFDADPIFKGKTKFQGVRFLHDYALAQQGWADDEDTALQAHFTNTAPAIVDVDQDGENDIVMLGSVQNTSQADRERGVALWVVRHDGTRPDDWIEPFHAPGFIDGLWDPGDNIVGATNQATVVDLDPASDGFEYVFAGFDGRIHAVTSDKRELWQYTFTTKAGVLTGGLAAADLSRDGRPELVFNTYSTASGQGALFILGANGGLLHEMALPDRGAMPVPTIADVDDDGQLEIVVSLKDAVDKERQVLVYTVPGSGTDCMPWPTGRGNLRRSGAVAAQ